MLPIRVALVVLVVAAPLAAARAQQFEAVPLAIVGAVEVTSPDGSVFDQSLPVTDAWSFPGASGTLSVSETGGEIELVLTADVNANSVTRNFSARIELQADIVAPHVGSPRTPTAFTVELVSSDRVLTDAQVDPLVAVVEYQNTVLGQVSEEAARTAGATSSSVIVETLPGPATTRDGANRALILEIDWTLAAPATEIFSETYRLRAQAIQPLVPSVVTALPAWAPPVIVGILIGLSLRWRARAG